MAEKAGKSTSPLRLFQQLKNHSGSLVLLPTGLYRMDNTLIDGSADTAGNLLQVYPVGAELQTGRLPLLPGLALQASHFVQVSHTSCGAAWPVPPDQDLSIEKVRDTLLGLRYSESSHPYRNYLEAACIQLYIDGLALGKKLSGGVWLSDAAGSAETGVWVLEALIQLKNEAIYAVSAILKQYPLVFTANFSRFIFPAWRDNLPLEQGRLEYLALQLRHKNLLQELATQSRVMTAQDRQTIEDEIREVEVLKSGYPVKIEPGCSL